MTIIEENHAKSIGCKLVENLI